MDEGVNIQRIPRKLEVIVGPRTPPTGPSPNMRIAAEIVAVGALHILGKEAVPTDHSNAGVVPIPLKEFRTECEEADTWYTIVF